MSRRVLILAALLAALTAAPMAAHADACTDDLAADRVELGHDLIRFNQDRASGSPDLAAAVKQLQTDLADFHADYLQCG